MNHVKLSLILLIATLILATSNTPHISVSASPPTNHWFKTIDGSNDDGGTSVVYGGDGYLYITGTTKSYGAGNGDAFAMLMSPSIGNDLHWVNGENWETVSVTDASAVESTQNPGSNAPNPTLGTAYNPSVDSASILPTGQSPETHIAEDNNTPQPLPEPWVTVVFAVVAAIVF